MQEPDRTELQSLRLRHAQLERELTFLGQRLAALEGRIAEPASPATVDASQSIVEVPVGRSSASSSDTILAVPPVIAAQETGPGTLPPLPTARMEPAFAATSPASPEFPLPPETGGNGSFEMRLGTYWLVRIGVVMVLTALVFFGNLAYQHYISQLGPGGKIALLYAASLLLLGAGAWWQRNLAKENLRNYAQVLFAGGLAAVYFTTYAAHHFPLLRVITSPLLDGTLLLAWTGFIVWIADRKKSEVMAMFAVGLAFYTSVITRVGYFTLYSNLLLCAAALFFLVRNRWAALSFGTLIGSYAAYGFWRFFGPDGWRWASAADGLWTGAYFLFAYWVIFTAAVFLSRNNERFAFQQRSLFLSINNAALLVLFILTMLQVREGGLWRFLLIYGGVLLGLAALARKFLSQDPLATAMYLTQGLVLVTLGLISKFTGIQLALMLAGESVILLVFGQQRPSRVMMVGAYVAAALSVAWGLDYLLPNQKEGLYTGLALGVFMFTNAMFCSRVHQQNSIIRPQVAYFTCLALIVLLAVTWLNAQKQMLPLILATEALVLVLSSGLLRVRELALLGQFFLLLAHFAALIFFDKDATHWVRPAMVVALTFGLGVWWRQYAARAADIPSLEGDAGLLVQRLYWFLGAVASLYWIHAYIPLPDTIWAFGTVGLVLFLIAGARKDRELLLLSPLFSAAAIVLTWFELLQLHPVRWMLVFAAVLLLAQQRLAKAQSEKYELPESVNGPVLVVGGLTLWWVLSRWVMESASGFYLTASWSVFALVLFSIGVVTRERVYRWLGLGILACAVARVVIFDVWKLDTAFRVLSFLALGVVLMVLGFIYNRFQDKIRQWL